MLTKCVINFKKVLLDNVLKDIICSEACEPSLKLLCFCLTYGTNFLCCGNCPIIRKIIKWRSLFNNDFFSIYLEIYKLLEMWCLL